jgi:creatinine amidohydrolase
VPTIRQRRERLSNKNGPSHMTTLPTRYMIDLTRDEIAAHLKASPLILLPAGSVEQHGPHLPTGTDTFAAEIISHAVAERMNGLVVPWTPLGVTPMHAPFPGTITLSPDTYMRMVVETCASLAKHGAKRLLIVNWHEGNSAPLAIASEALHREHGLSVVTCHACYVAADLYGPTSGGLTHGGEIEALAVLAYRPELVHLDRVTGSSDAGLGHKMDKLRRTKNFIPVLTDIRSIAPSGWFGKPEHATVDKGHRMLADVADAVAREASEIFAQLDQVQGGGFAETKGKRRAG